MDFNSPPPCPNTVTIRRNPHRKARDTPRYTPAPDSLNLKEMPPFPNDDLLSAAQTPEVPSTSFIQKPENENLRVFLRIRPLPIASPNQAPRVRAKSVWPQNPTKKNNLAAGTKTSKKKSSASCILVNDSQSVTLSPPLDLQESKRIKSETYGGFSHVFSSYSSQSEVYERMVEPMVEEFLQGRSGMLAALGPSGSGKTHTVFGSPRDPGMVPLALRHIFKGTESDAKQSSRSFYISIFEIYTERGKAEKLFDLLPDGGELSMQQSTIKGLQEVVVSSAEQAETLIMQATVKRATAMTKTNSQSSRSQCIINFREVPPLCNGVTNPKSNSAVLTIIDLAGAEREKRTGNQGTRLVESNFINNTLMVLGLCLRSLLEHQKNPRKPLQKHFQNSLLTRYMRDYLTGKKRMTLILTAKPGEEDYLDTSYLLRQTSPFMQIKYDEVEANVTTKKRHHHALSAMDYVKPSPVVEHRKRKKLGIGEQTLQNDESVVEECNTSTEDASTVCKLDETRSVSFKSECDSHARSERSHIIMQNFAKAVWNMLKQYNSKLKVAEKEIQCLKKSIGYEKEKYLVLETELNELKAYCTCCKRGKESSEARYDQSDEELTLGTSCTWEDWISVSKSGHRNASEVEGADRIPSELSKPRLDQSDEVPLICNPCTRLDFEKTDREVHTSPSKPGHPNSLEGVCNSEIFCAPAATIDEETTVGTSCTQSDSEKSYCEIIREAQTPLSKPGHHEALLAEVSRNAPSETSHVQESSEARIDESVQEPTLGIPCTKKVQFSSSESESHNSLEIEATIKIPSETSYEQESSEPKIDESNREPMLGTSCTKLDFEKSNREVLASLSESGSHNTLEADAMIKKSSGLLISSSPIKEVVDSLPSKNPKPKRTLMPSSSMLSRDVAFDLVEKSEKSKGTRKLAASDQKRSNGSISLLRMLQSKGNLHRQRNH